MENKKIFANRLKEAREHKKMTQTELAEAVGYKNYTTITKWESGDHPRACGYNRTNVCCCK